MDEQALIDSEREGTRMKKAMAQAELDARKVLWARAKVEWEEKHQALADAGGSKGGAGKPPLLHDIQYTWITGSLCQLHYPAALKSCRTHR